MKVISFFRRAFLLLTTFFLLATPLLARALAPGVPTSALRLPQGFTTANRFLLLLLAVVEFFFALLVGLAILMLLWAAFLYLTAGGDEEKIKTAKRFIIYSVIALFIAFITNGIPFMVQRFIGV